MSRISKGAFVITTGCLLALALLGVIVRFFVRFRVQRQQLTVDDEFLILAVALLIANSVIMYNEVVPRTYVLASALEDDISDWKEMSYEFNKFNVVCGMLGWASFNAIKFSFLFLFKRIIDRVRFWHIYWWIVVVYTLGLVGYGFAAVYLACPYFYDPMTYQCADERDVILYSTLNISLDIMGDLLILVIPISIIWRIHLPWTQKLVIGGSLCVAFIMIILMITRAAGLVHNGVADTTWAIFWHFVNAEIAVFLASSAVPFRTLFVARKSKNIRAQQVSSPRSWALAGFHKKVSSARSPPPRRSSDTLGNSVWYGGASSSLTSMGRLSRERLDDTGELGVGAVSPGGGEGLGLGPLPNSIPVQPDPVHTRV